MRHILACLRFYSAIFVLVMNPSIFRNIQLQPYSQAYSKHYAQYLSRFKVIQNPGFFRHVMIRAYSVIFTLDIFRPFCQHSGIFWLIQAYLESWHSQTYSCILRHIRNPWLIQAYSESQTYLASFRHYSRAIHAYSKPYLSRFRHIQNSGLFRHVMFQEYFLHWDSDISRILGLPVQVMESNTCS